MCATYALALRAVEKRRKALDFKALVTHQWITTAFDRFLAKSLKGPFYMALSRQRTCYPHKR
jgi:hypothetical protein